jgi:hypothetical protein
MSRDERRENSPRRTTLVVRADVADDVDTAEPWFAQEKALGTIVNVQLAPAASRATGGPVRFRVVKVMLVGSEVMDVDRYERAATKALPA